MKTTVKIIAILAAAILSFPQKPSAVQYSDKPQELATWIMGIVVQKARENEKQKRDLVTYDKKVVKSNIQRNPPRVLETSVYSVYGENGRSFEKLKERNGRNITNARPEMSQWDLNSIITERYDFNLEKEEFMEGRWYYVISFKPKEPIDKLPFEDRLDEGFNRAVGYLFIDLEKFYLKRMEGRLSNRFTKALSIFEMKDFSLTFEQSEFEGIIVPSSLVLTYRYRVFWGETSEKLEYSYSNHQKRMP